MWNDLIYSTVELQSTGLDKDEDLHATGIVNDSELEA